MVLVLLLFAHEAVLTAGEGSGSAMSGAEYCEMPPLAEEPETAVWGGKGLLYLFPPTPPYPLLPAYRLFLSLSCFLAEVALAQHPALARTSWGWRQKKTHTMI